MYSSCGSSMGNRRILLRYQVRPDSTVGIGKSAAWAMIARSRLRPQIDGRLHPRAWKGHRVRLAWLFVLAGLDQQRGRFIPGSRRRQCSARVGFGDSHFMPTDPAVAGGGVRVTGAFGSSLNCPSVTTRAPLLTPEVMMVRSPGFGPPLIRRTVAVL